MQAENVVDSLGVPIRGKSPLLFHSHPVMCLINYSEALEEEGTFGEVAKNAWKKAATGWADFSNRDLPTMYNFAIRLGEKEAYDKRAEDARAELAKLTPAGLREKIDAEKLAALSETEREAHDTPDAQRTKEQRDLIYTVDGKLNVSHFEIADRIPGADRAAALKAAADATQAEMVSKAISGERDIVNYDYWLLRCQIEPEDDTLVARKLFYDGDRAYTAAKLQQSFEFYTEGLKKWRQVLNAHPALLADQNLTDDLHDSIDHYRATLRQLDDKFPQPFTLQDVLDAHVKFHGPDPSQTPSEDENTSGDSNTPAKPNPAGDASSSANDPGKPQP